MRILISLLLLLAACQPRGSDLTARTTYRDPAAVLASKADFAPEKMSGSWHEVARYPGTPGPTCNRRVVGFAALEDGSLAMSESCDGAPATGGRADPTGPGRIRQMLHGRTDDIWVLWTDTGYRTAILVHRDGSGGRILNRDTAIPVDRLRAALEVLDFNGFDTTQLTYPAPN